MKDNKKQAKVYSFDRSHIKDGVISSNDLIENEVVLSESFLTYALECYKGQKLESGQLIEEMIKVMLPFNEDAAKEEWNNGLIFNDKKYYAWFATTGGMKKEENGICETLFIREDFVEFTREFEDLISLGKFKEIEESKEKICINKDVLSRISLGTSTSDIAGDMPNFIILPQATYRIVKDYKTVEKFTKEIEDSNGNKKDVIDYNLIDYHFDNDVDMFDGGGIATPLVFEQIKKELKLKYPVEFAIIRAYGLGIKGMITKFDIIGYLKEFYKEDTEYVKKENGKFYLLDMWKDWQPVTTKTILLNESMVKLAKYFYGGMKEYNEKLEEVDEKYKDIINKLYVTKVNKADKDIPDYRRTNYQLMNALALSKKDYLDLTKEDIKAYRKILKSYVKDEEGNWQIDIDAIRLFFKNIVGSDDEEEIIDTLSNVASKSEELLNISEDFVKLKYVKNNLARLVEKKCRDIASGKFTTKAKYQYISVCPISYMNFAMYRDQKGNGLNEGQFYSGDCEDGDIRTISRNPLCAYSEVHNVKFVRGDLLDKYLSKCKELIYFNQKSDILNLMSSGDADGDACTVVDNEIIRNAVVIPEDGKYFINVNDGEKVEMEYNSENRFLATYRASGNLIGSIALKSASINSNSQQTYYYYNTINKEFELYTKDDEEETKAKLKSGELVRTSEVPELHKEHIRQRFYENEKDIYTVLYNAMVSIDAPKTLFFPSKADMEIINNKYPRKAWFLQYQKPKKDFKLQHYQYTFGLLDAFSKEIQRVLLGEIDNIVIKFDNKAELIQTKLINGDYKIKDYDNCLEELTRIYESYTSERKLADKECWKRIKKEEENREVMMGNYSWSQWEEDLYFDTVVKYRDKKRKKYKEIDAKYILLADELMKKYDIATIANCIGNLENCTEDFIINLFFPVFHYLNEKLKSNRYVYIKDESGEIRYLYEKYRKIVRDNIDTFNIVQSLHLEEKKRLKVTDLNESIRAKILDTSVVDMIREGLRLNKHVKFDVRLDNDDVILQTNNKDVLSIFQEWSQIKQYNLKKCTSIRIENLGKVNKSSLAMTLTELDIED